MDLNKILRWNRKTCRNEHTYCTVNEMVYLKTTITPCYGKVNSGELAVTYKIIVALFKIIRSTVLSH